MTLLATFADVFKIVFGVLSSLCGLGIVLMGVLAMSARNWRRGAIGAGVGVVLTVVGFLLVGVL